MGDAGREHPFNAGNAHVIGAFQVTGPFHKCARGQDCQRWEMAPASERCPQTEFSLSSRPHSHGCLTGSFPGNH